MNTTTNVEMVKYFNETIPSETKEWLEEYVQQPIKEELGYEMSSYVHFKTQQQHLLWFNIKDPFELSYEEIKCRDKIIQAILDRLEDDGQPAPDFNLGEKYLLISIPYLQ